MRVGSVHMLGEVFSAANRRATICGTKVDVHAALGGQRTCNTTATKNAQCKDNDFWRM